MEYFEHYVFQKDNGTLEVVKSKIYDTLVIGGGGFKGTQFLGALHYLNENGYLQRFQNYFGVSVGAIICLLLILDYSPLEQFNMIDIKNIFKIQKKRPFINFLLPTLLEKYVDKQTTFLQLFEKTNKHFFCIAYDCTLGRECLFSACTTPNVSVLDALVASCSIPFASTPYIIQNSKYIDGGIINNLPIDHAVNFDMTKDIIVLYLTDEENEINNNLNILQLFSICIQIPSRQLDLFRLELTKNSDKNILKCNFPTVTGLEHIIMCTDKEQLFRQGYDRMENFLSTTNKIKSWISDA